MDTSAPNTFLKNLENEYSVRRTIQACNFIKKETLTDVFL